MIRIVFVEVLAQKTLCHISELVNKRVQFSLVEMTFKGYRRSQQLQSSIDCTRLPISRSIVTIIHAYRYCFRHIAK